jgi:hypothetical protein
MNTIKNVAKKVLVLSPDFIPRHVYENAKNKYMNPHINNTIRRHMENVRLIEYSESHSPEPFYIKKS